MLPFKLLYHPGFVVDLGPHVFPAQKYRLVRERLLRDGVAEAADFVEPSAASDADMERVHEREYLARLKQGRLSAVEQRRLELPWSPQLVEGAWLASGAGIAAGRLARRDGCACVVGGGFHHAFADHGEGFCAVNDVAVAIGALRAAGEVARVAVVDLDVHQGNGTAAILAPDPLAFTVSLHQEDNYPLDKPASDIDVGLPDATGDADYLAALERPLQAALAFGPDVLFYLAGADPYEHDLLGGLGLTIDGLAERDRRVLAAARAAGVPAVVALAGGYAENSDDTVTIHVNTVRTAQAVFT